MKTQTIVLIGIAVIAYIAYKNATVTITSDVQQIRSLAQLPKTLNVSELLSKSKSPETQIVRVSLSI